MATETVIPVGINSRILSAAPGESTNQTERTTWSQAADPGNDDLMMAYYHLSTEDGLKVIVPSFDIRAPGTCQPRIPEDCANENRTIKRVCVGPSVWQCLLSIPRKGKLFIYLVETAFITDPVVIPGKVHDFDQTGERWITDRDIRMCGGSIVMVPQGFVEYTYELELAIRSVVGYPVSPTAGSDGYFWTFRQGEWLLKDSLTCATMTDASG
jgi:hypothetical protein